MNSLCLEKSEKAVDLSVWRRSAAVWLVALGVAGISGCATLQPASAEAAVRERSQQRWDALVRGDTNAAYEFFSPGSKAILTRDGWAASLKKGFWKSARVDKVSCASPESCEAYVTIEYQFQGLTTKTPLRESWVKDGSNWWYVQK